MKGKRKIVPTMRINKKGRKPLSGKAGSFLKDGGKKKASQDAPGEEPEASCSAVDTCAAIRTRSVKGREVPFLTGDSQAVKAQRMAFLSPSTLDLRATALLLRNTFQSLLKDVGLGATARAMGIGLILDSTQEPQPTPPGPNISPRRALRVLASTLVERTADLVHSAACKIIVDTQGKYPQDGGCRYPCLVAAQIVAQRNMLCGHDLCRAWSPLALEMGSSTAQEIKGLILQPLKKFALCSLSHLWPMEVCGKMRALGQRLRKIHATLPPRGTPEEGVDFPAAAELSVLQGAEELIREALSATRLHIRLEGLLAPSERTSLNLLFDSVLSHLTLEGSSGASGRRPPGQQRKAVQKNSGACPRFSLPGMPLYWTEEEEESRGCHQADSCATGERPVLFRREEAAAVGAVLQDIPNTLQEESCPRLNDLVRELLRAVLQHISSTRGPAALSNSDVSSLREELLTQLLRDIAQAIQASVQSPNGADSIQADGACGPQGLDGGAQETPAESPEAESRLAGQLVQSCLSTLEDFVKHQVQSDQQLGRASGSGSFGGKALKFRKPQVPLRTVLGYARQLAETILQSVADRVEKDMPKTPSLRIPFYELQLLNILLEPLGGCRQHSDHPCPGPGVLERLVSLDTAYRRDLEARAQLTLGRTGLVADDLTQITRVVLEDLRSAVVAAHHNGDASRSTRLQAVLREVVEEITGPLEHLPRARGKEQLDGPRGEGAVALPVEHLLDHLARTLPCWGSESPLLGGILPAEGHQRAPSHHRQYASELLSAIAELVRKDLEDEMACESSSPPCDFSSVAKERLEALCQALTPPAAAPYCGLATDTDPVSSGPSGRDPEENQDPDEREDRAGGNNTERPLSCCDGEAPPPEPPKEESTAAMLQEHSAEGTSNLPPPQKASSEGTEENQKQEDRAGGNNTERPLSCCDGKAPPPEQLKDEDTAATLQEHSDEGTSNLPPPQKASSEDSEENQKQEHQAGGNNTERPLSCCDGEVPPPEQLKEEDTAATARKHRDAGTSVLPPALKASFEEPPKKVKKKKSLFRRLFCCCA